MKEHDENNLKKENEINNYIHFTNDVQTTRFNSMKYYAGIRSSGGSDQIKKKFKHSGDEVTSSIVSVMILDKIDCGESCYHAILR